jgi:hypothetical protein
MVQLGLTPSHKRYTVKNVVDFPVPSRDVTNQTLPGQGEFGYFHTGWGRENRQPFLQCIRTAIEYGVAQVLGIVSDTWTPRYIVDSAL